VESVSEEYRFALPVKVRFRDIDAMGHVNNIPIPPEWRSKIKAFEHGPAHRGE
jgi:hypothetical protein